MIVRVTAAVVAVALGTWADPALDRELWRLLVAAAAILVLSVPAWPGLRRRLRPRLRAEILLFLALAALAQSAALDLWRFVTTPEVRVWNVYHYYLGAKYFDELGYHDLYDATLAADREGGDYWRGIDRVRNLRSYDTEPRLVSELRYRPEEHFSEERWREFQRDVEALQTQLPPGRWEGIFVDRGYNPSPFWTVVGGVLTDLLPATHLLALKLLSSLDLFLFAATFLLLGRVFGLRAAAVVLLFFTLTPVNDGRLVGGFLQYDWFCAVAAGVAFLRRGRPAVAGGLVAYAVLARIFPAVFLLSAAIPAVILWVRRGELRRRALAFFLVAAAAGAVGLGVGSLTARGPAAWGDFFGNLSHHSGEHLYGERRVGLQHLFTHDLTRFEVDESSSERRELFERQKSFYLAAAAVFLLLYLAGVHRRSLPDALLWGLAPLFVLAVSSRYYWAFLALLPLLARPGPPGRRRGRVLDVAQAALYLGYALFALHGAERYAAYWTFNLLLALFFLLFLVLHLHRELRLRRRRLGVDPPWHRSRAVAALFFLGLFLLLVLLRAPLAQYPIRDVDESVSALIAASWLDGGVPYRDAIDQRGPVTYLIYAAVFAVAGVYDMVAVHWALLLLILGTCFLLFRFARTLEPGVSGVSLGYLAAAFLAVFSFTYRRSQMLAFHTEWPLMLAAAAGMFLLVRGLTEGRDRWLLLAGLAFGAGFLSKQPGIFDGAAAGGFLLLHQAFDRRLFTAQTVRRAALLAGGFVAAVGVAVLYFLLHGALADFYLYFWSYNVEHYTRVVTLGERLANLDPFSHSRHYLTANPLLLIAVPVQLVTVAVRLFARWGSGRRAAPEAVDGRLLVVLWFLCAYLGASYSGRNFGHYFIQILVPASLLAAWTVRDGWRALAPDRDAWRRLGDLAGVGRGALVAAVLVLLALPVYRFRGDLAWLAAAEDPRRDRVREGILRAIEETTGPEDTIFVWGYYPELYVLSDRRPASRYSNTNYLTGMLPWENHQPGVDTSEHVVPDAWEILMRELEASRPGVVIDTAPGDHRYYAKYPISDYPLLQRFLERSYRPVATVEDRRGDVAAVIWGR
jgi:4-amino-4-deoxy-L-arabinose transferase-like glycosyltransferase